MSFLPIYNIEKEKNLIYQLKICLILIEYMTTNSNSSASNSVIII